MTAGIPTDHSTTRTTWGTGRGHLAKSDVTLQWPLSKPTQGHVEWMCPSQAGSSHTVVDGYFPKTATPSNTDTTAAYSGPGGAEAMLHDI